MRAVFLLAAAAAVVLPARAQDARAAPNVPVTVTPPVEPRIEATPLPPPVELPPPPGEPGTPRPLTAQEAAEIALQRQSLITEAASGVEAATGRERTIRAGLKPSAGLTAGYTHLDRLSGSGSSGAGSNAGGYTAGVSARQLLYDFAYTRNLARQAAALREAAAANLTRVQADTVLQTKQAFYTLLQDTRLVEVNEANLRAQQAHVALARARLDAGVGLPSDVVRAETAVAEAALALNLARNAASLARVTLNNRMGIDPRTPVEPAASSEPPPPSLELDPLVQAALGQRPEAVQAEAAIRAAEAGVGAARAFNAPVISGTVGLNTRGDSLSSANTGLTVGAVIQWDVFDGGATAGRVQTARADVAGARAALEGIRQDVIADVSAAYLDLVSAEQRIATAAAQVTNAEESVRLAEGRYRGGLGTFLEVTDAQAALLAAQTSQVNAQADVDLARAALARATGSSLPAEG